MVSDPVWERPIGAGWFGQFGSSSGSYRSARVDFIGRLQLVSGGGGGLIAERAFWRGLIADPSDRLAGSATC